KIFQELFDLGFAQVRISIGIEQASFSRHQRAAAIHFNRTTFENHPRREERQTAQVRDVLWNGVVQIERRIFAAPGVVAPIDDGSLALAIAFADEKDWAMV